jgi:hypothetical protein
MHILIACGLPKTTTHAIKKPLMTLIRELKKSIIVILWPTIGIPLPACPV